MKLLLRRDQKSGITNRVMAAKQAQHEQRASSNVPILSCNRWISPRSQGASAVS